MKVNQSFVCILLICLYCISSVECKREVRNLAVRSSRSSGRSSGSGGSSSSTTYTSSDSLSTAEVIIIAVVVPLGVFIIVFSCVRMCRRRQMLKIQQLAAQQNLQMRMQQGNLNQQMIMANQAQGVAVDPYFQNNNINNPNAGVANQNMYGNTQQNGIYQPNQFIYPNQQPYYPQQYEMAPNNGQYPAQQVNTSMYGQQIPIVNATVL